MKTVATASVSTLFVVTTVITQANAADLPVAVEPVDYVRICDAYGKGFFYIPGTDTCLYVAGRIRADYNAYFALKDAPGLFDDQGFDNTDKQGYRFRARGNIYIDSRTATEFGLLRTFLELEVTRDSNATGGGGTATDVSLESAFIQYGGFTFGRTESLYDFSDAEFSEAQTFDPSLSDNQINLIAYTKTFGEFAATLSLEDTTDRRSAIAEGDYGGAQIPDVVGVLRWAREDVGSAQIMAVGHYINAIGFVDPANPNKPQLRTTDEDYGFAVGGGFTLNVPFGNDTEIGATASYSRGALSYLSTDITAPFDVYDAAFGSSATHPIGRNIGLSEGFSVSGGFGTHLTDMVRLGVNAGYLYVNGASTNVDFDENGSTDRLKVQNIDAQAYLAYEPVEDFELGVGAEYRHVDAHDLGTGDILTTFFRAQRTF